MAIYEFAPFPENDSYVFLTSSGWIYIIKFTESAEYFNENEILHNNALVYEISFSCISDHPIAPRKKYDPFVKETIHAILFSHLEARGNIPYYLFICHDKDGKQAARLSLFSNWFESFETAHWRLYSFELVEENTTLYYGLIVNIKHPVATSIPAEFEKFIEQEKNIWKELLRRR